MSTTTQPRSEVRAEPGVSGPAIVGAIMAKDAVAFTRNRFIMFITIMVLVVWAIVYQFLPTTVDETFSIGVVVEEGSVDPDLLQGLDLGSLEGQSVADETTGVEVTVYGDRSALEVAVSDGDDVTAGLIIPAGLQADLATSGAEIILLIPAGLPPQFASLLDAVAQEIGYALSGQAPPVDLETQTQIVGTDRVGNQISLAEQMRPLLLIVVLLMEVFALSTLVAGEVQERTATAILATPANSGHLITAKGLFGTVLAFSEVVLLGLLIGAFTESAGMVLLALLLGAFMVTGLGLLAGAFGRDFMDTLIIGMLIMIPLLVPAMAAFLPGEPALWVKILPTYGLVTTVIDASSGELTWSQAAGPMLAMLAWGVGLLFLGAWTLNRRVAKI